MQPTLVSPIDKTPLGGLWRTALVAASLLIVAGIYLVGLTNSGSGTATSTAEPKAAAARGLPVEGGEKGGLTALAASSDFSGPVLLPSELGALEIEDDINAVAIVDELLFSPTRRTHVETEGMAEALGFDPALQAVVVDDRGRVAFTDPIADGHTIYDPGGKSTSSIVVVDPEAKSAGVMEFTFEGNIVPEVFTADGESLFVINHLPPMDPTFYEVARLDLASGELSEVLGPLKEPPSPMEGIGRRQVGTGDGTFLFTLYTRQPAHHDGSEHGDHLHGFIHALSLRNGWAVCLDLPNGFGQGESGTAAIAVDTADEHLFVVDAIAGAIASFAVADLSGSALTLEGVLPTPTQVINFEVLSGQRLVADQSVHAVATADTLWVGQGDRLFAIDVALSTVVGGFQTEAGIETVTLSSEGDAYALVDGQLVSLTTSSN
jgi:hypothetical protein